MAQQAWFKWQRQLLCWLCHSVFPIKVLVMFACCCPVSFCPPTRHDVRCYYVVNMAVKLKNMVPFFLVGSDVLLIISVLICVQFWWNNFNFLVHFQSLLFTSNFRTVLKPMTHQKVSCESHLRKKLLQENLHKWLSQLHHDTFESWNMKVAG